MIHHLPLLLADVEASDLIGGSHSGPDSRLLYSVAVFGSIVLAVIIAFVWAVLYSLRRKKRKHHHRAPEPQRPAAPATATPAATATEANGSEEKDPQRRRRSRHRPMNPTLAETRGLPPMRDEDTPLPPMP